MSRLNTAIVELNAIFLLRQINTKKDNWDNVGHFAYEQEVFATFEHKPAYRLPAETVP